MTLSLCLGDQTITSLASNIQTKNAIAGGFASVSFNLQRKLDQSLLTQFTDCYVYDAATGEQIGGGRLMEQGRNDDGTWAVTCLGEGLASMQDRKTPYMLVDRSLEQWTFRQGNTIRHKAAKGTQPGATNEGLLFQVEAGTFAQFSLAGMTYEALILTDQLLGSLDYAHIEGGTDSGNRVLAQAGDGTVVRNDGWSVSTTPVSPAYVGTHIPPGNDRVTLFIQRNGVANTAGDATWALVFGPPVVQAQRLDKNGALITGSVYATGYVTIDQAFTDFVARYCPRLDIANARVDVGTHQFDQLTYFDGIDGNGLMGDLTALETGFTWQVWEKNPNGKWAVELKQLKNSVQYEASTADGFNAPSPSTEIYKKITITGKTSDGADVNVTRTQEVPALDDAGIIRETTATLGTALWSQQNAEITGDNFLDSHKVAPNAGTLTVARPIYDANSGRWVKPWNIRSGGLIRVRGIQPTPDTLNATSPDGVTVFRVVSVTYDDDSGAATLELDSQVLTTGRALANIVQWAMVSSDRQPTLEKLKVTTSGR